MSADVEVERDERGTTLNFGILDPLERKVAAALFEVGEVRAGGQWGKTGTYDETTAGIQWLANDASTIVSCWRRDPTPESVKAAAVDTALMPPFACCARR